MGRDQGDEAGRKRLSIKEIARRTGHSRNTIRAALRSARATQLRRPGLAPPRSSTRIQGKDRTSCSATTARSPRRCIRERITEAGYAGGKTILDDYVRELRPVFSPPRTFQRTHYQPGELVQFDLWEPSRPRSRSATARPRRGWVVSCVLGLLTRRRRRAGLLQAGPRHPLGHEPLPGRARGAASQSWSGTARERSTRGGGQPTDAFAAFCGAARARLGDPRAQATAEAKGMLERLHRLHRAKLRAGARLRQPRSTTKTSSTAGSPSAPTRAFTAASGRCLPSALL